MKNPTTFDDVIIGSLTLGGRADLLPLWQMTAAERLALLTVLREIRPEVAVEVGTAQGGSLAIIAAHAARVYSLDVDPDCERRLATRFDNVIFRAGRSQDTLPAVLADIDRRGRALQVVLVDGDHSREGVRRDVELVLKYRPHRPMVILLHDSFNPFCRYGMRDVDWAANPHVRAVELDFVPGGTYGPPDRPTEMWGGLGAALLSPEPRTGPLVVGERNRRLFDEMVPRSAHAPYFGFPTAERAEIVAMRERVAARVPGWRADARRVAVYGTGGHTRTLFDTVPELLPLVSTFVDGAAAGEYLGRPCIVPAAFSPTVADVVVYSSHSHEPEMFANLRDHAVEHVRLYA